MRRQRTIGLLAVLGALLVVVLGATAAAAQPPVKEVIQVDDVRRSGPERRVRGRGHRPHHRPGHEFTFPDGSVVYRT